VTISTGTPIPAGHPTTAAPSHQPATGPADRSDPPVPRPADGPESESRPGPSDGKPADEKPADEKPAEAEAAGSPGAAAADAGPSAGSAAAEGTSPAADPAPDSDSDSDSDPDPDGDPDAVDTGPVPRLERLREALPTLPGPGLTVAGGTLLGAGLVGLGAALDIALGHGLGLGFKVTFVVTCVVIAFAVRIRALGAAVVLPPLLYAAASVLQTVSSGQITGRRAAALDVATTLALTAPLLFLGTAVAAAIALSRGLAHLVRR
jgi:hypothetical protein